MLIQLFPEKCWFNIFLEKCYNIFLKNVETFCNARTGGRNKKKAVRWVLVGWNFASLSTFR
jgi:hypothetical protein